MMVAPAPIDASLTGLPAPTATAAAAPMRKSGRLFWSTESTSTRSKRCCVPVATDPSRSAMSDGSGVFSSTTRPVPSPTSET